MYNNRAIREEDEYEESNPTSSQVFCLKMFFFWLVRGSWWVGWFGSGGLCVLEWNRQWLDFLFFFVLNEKWVE